MLDEYSFVLQAILKKFDERHPTITEQTDLLVMHNSTGWYMGYNRYISQPSIQSHANLDHNVGNTLRRQVYGQLPRGTVKPGYKHRPQTDADL